VEETGALEVPLEWVERVLLIALAEELAAGNFRLPA
jgi:hypothetical protein